MMMVRLYSKILDDQETIQVQNKAAIRQVQEEPKELHNFLSDDKRRNLFGMDPFKDKRQIAKFGRSKNK